MKSVFLLLLLLFISGSLLAQELTVKDLSVEHRKNPVGIDVQQPRFSWKISGNGTGIMQTAFSIRAATDPKFSSGKIIWQSGKNITDSSILQTYDGPALKSGQRYFWQVKVWDNRGKESKWSETAYWETGLLSPSDGKAKWIEMDSDTNRYAPSPHFRKEFLIGRPVANAVIYVTSHGLYELHLNGKKVGDQVLTPGWTSYGKRLQYQAYDVTNQLVRGENTIGAVLGDGWYRGTLAWGNNWAIYGKRLGLLMQMKIIYADGSESLIVTDESWKCYYNGAIRMNDLYNGEIYDANKKLTGWERKNGKIIVSIKIPANTRATIMLPVDDPVKITESSSPLSSDKFDFVIMEENKEGKRTGLVRGSGDYVFEFIL